MALPAGFNVAEAVAQSYFVESVYTAYEANKSNLEPRVVLPAGYNLIAWIQMTDTFLVKVPQFYGVITQNNTDPTEHIIAFRGTDSALEWIDNAWANLVPFTKVPDAGKTHEGFTTIYDTIQVVDVMSGPADALPTGSFADQVATVVQRSSIADSVAPKTLRLVSHSLGAALMSLYVLDNASKDVLPRPIIYTFGSPRVGDATFAAKYGSLGLESWRIANAPDLVPQLPLAGSGYVHVDTGVDIDSTGYVAYSPA